MNALAHGAQAFIGLFQKGGEQFVNNITGILPTLIVLMTAVNAVVKLIGEERVQKLAQSATKILSQDIPFSHCYRYFS